MRPVCSYTDFFVICTAQNPRQAKAVYDEVHERLKAESRTIPHNVDGVREATWILADYLDIVLHVFTPEARVVLPARGALGRRAVGRGRDRRRGLDPERAFRALAEAADRVDHEDDGREQRG